LSQPFRPETLSLVFEKCLITAFLMLDTIAHDCLNLKSQNLTKLWKFACDWSDHIIGISDFSIKQTAASFFVDSKKTSSVLLSCAPKKDNKINSIKINSNYILIYGNHFEHKFVLPTLNAIRNELRNVKIKVFGITGISQKNVEFIPSGKMDEKKHDELICGAKYVVYPTLNEGFGFPIRDIPYYNKKIFCRNLSCFSDIKNSLPPAIQKNIIFYKNTKELVQLLKNLREDLSNQFQESPLHFDKTNITWETQFAKLIKILTSIQEPNQKQIADRFFYLKNTLEKS